jgi:hypothetical protein
LRECWQQSAAEADKEPGLWAGSGSVRSQEHQNGF